jgi:hypothetical protein
MPTEFKMFESGGGGDFATFEGVGTGNFYRLDLGKVHHLKISEESLILPAKEKEGSLKRVPEQLKCNACGAMLSAQGIMCDREEIIDAYDL